MTQPPEELREQVERTRHELGRTVEALAAKADVKARAREKAAELTHQAAVKAAELREQAAAGAGAAKAEIAGSAARVRDGLPEPVRHVTARSARAARRNRPLLLTVAVAGTAAAAVWLARHRRRA